MNFKSNGKALQYFYFQRFAFFSNFDCGFKVIKKRSFYYYDCFAF